MSRLITAVWVPGHPKTKGSLTFKGGSYVEENVKGSKEWRALVTKVVEDDLTMRAINAAADPGALVRTTRPVFVRLAFFIDHPDPCGATVRAGDLDKLVRNVLDALTDAGAYVDDNQVMSVAMSKVPSYGTPGNSGVAIEVIELNDTDTGLTYSRARTFRNAIRGGV